MTRAASACRSRPFTTWRSSAPGNGRKRCCRPLRTTRNAARMLARGWRCCRKCRANGVAASFSGCGSTARAGPRSRARSSPTAMLNTCSTRPCSAPGRRGLTLDDVAAVEHLAERVDAYMIKAVRERKLDTSWSNPNPDYEAALTRYVRGVLDASRPSPFLADFHGLSRRWRERGRSPRLAQLALKLTVPGVPDIYQGGELWDFSMVDPDNRRPVDWEERAALLDEMRSRSAGRACRGVAGRTRKTVRNPPPVGVAPRPSGAVCRRRLPAARSCGRAAARIFALLSAAVAACRSPSPSRGWCTGFAAAATAPIGPTAKSCCRRIGCGRTCSPYAGSTVATGFPPASFLPSSRSRC